ncbi:hypothetical protein A33M_2750 [Rhodovulum sp. PH10]|nr:hypothetical protein A33M_2750 [Rhodovulum sp. PH10]
MKPGCVRRGSRDTPHIHLSPQAGRGRRPRSRGRRPRGRFHEPAGAARPSPRERRSTDTSPRMHASVMRGLDPRIHQSRNNGFLFGVMDRRVEARR